MAKPTEDEVNGQVNLAYESVDQGTTRWPGMTYEEGVVEALQWTLGNGSPPMDSED